MYKDIDFSLKKTEYNDAKLVEDEQSIRQSVSNILLTEKGELHYFPEFGSNIRKYLFEKVNPFVILAIKDEVTFALGNFEPRISRLQVDVYPSESNPNEIIIDMVYYIASMQKETTQQLILRLL